MSEVQYCQHCEERIACLMLCENCEPTHVAQQLKDNQLYLEQLLKRVLKERDDARFVARALINEGSFHMATVLEYEDAHPWIKEID